MSARARNKEEEEMIEWLQQFVRIEEIDDEDFRKALFFALTTQNEARRFQTHNSDLIYCLRASWAHKVIPSEFTEDEYSMVFHWLRGKGIEIGVVNALAKLLESVGKLDEIDLQKKVQIGESVGHVDLQMFGIPYEITTRLFFGSAKNPRIYPPSDKIIQDISYMVAQDKRAGRVKLYVMVPPTTFKIVKHGKLEAKKKVRKTERTWQLTLTKEGADYFKQVFKERGDILEEALETGDWSILPTAYFAWRCKGCTVCEYLENNVNEVKIAWLKWRKERDDFRRRLVQVLPEAEKLEKTVESNKGRKAAAG